MKSNQNKHEIKEYESILIELDNSDVIFLNKFHDKHVKTKQISNNKFEIKANSYIGLIELPSGIKILINPKININNLLYIISYTYDLVKIKNFDERSITKNNSLVDIYILVFTNWLDLLIKKGICKRYQTEAGRLLSVKGKIKISDNLLKSANIFCEFDELTISIKENQILKATLLLILKMKIVSPEIQQRVLHYFRLLNNIENIQLSDSIYTTISFDKFNYHYKPLIELSKLIYKNCRLTDNSDNNIFSGFMGDMNKIFDKFVLKTLQQNLKHEIIKYSIKNDWAIPNNEFLPQICPDILIKNKAIIDVKYYKTPFTSNNKLITNHIFQIVFYLQAYKIYNGILVYPEPDNFENIDYDYQMGEIRFSIFCIPLNKEIKDIEMAILKLKEKIVM